MQFSQSLVLKQCSLRLLHVSHAYGSKIHTHRNAELRWSPGKRPRPTGTEILEDQGTFTPVPSL